MRTMNGEGKGRLTQEQKLERSRLYDMYMTHYSQEALKWFHMRPYYFEYQQKLKEIKKC